jgi:hypothetical protein
VWTDLKIKCEARLKRERQLVRVVRLAPRNVDVATVASAAKEGDLEYVSPSSAKNQSCAEPFTFILDYGADLSPLLACGRPVGQECWGFFWS